MESKRYQKDDPGISTVYHYRKSHKSRSTMTVQQEAILADRSKCVHYKRLIAMAVCAALAISALSISGGTVSVQAVDISNPEW